jgi:hypothetical protein
MSMSKSTAMNERIDKALLHVLRRAAVVDGFESRRWTGVTADGSRKSTAIPIPQPPAGATCDSVVRKLSY